jgi:hypothetical protein
MRTKTLFAVLSFIFGATVSGGASASLVSSWTVSPGFVFFGEEATLELRLSLNILPDHRDGYLLQGADFVSGHVAVQVTFKGTISEFDIVPPLGGFLLFQKTISYAQIPTITIDANPTVSVTGLQYVDHFLCIEFISCAPVRLDLPVDVADLQLQTHLLVQQPLPAETPLPAALPLFATGLGALGLIGWRRKKKTAALGA